MESKEHFLQSRFQETENNFNLTIPIQANHKFIFDKLVSKFQPAAKITDDIKELVTRKDFNLCRDKNILIFYDGDSLKLNTLKFYLLMNFLSNWKPYKEYVSNLIPSENRLSYLQVESASLESILELRFNNKNNKDDNIDRLTNIYNVDILYLTVYTNTRLFDSEYYKDLFRTILNIRDSQRLITVVIFLGSEQMFKDYQYESKIIETPMKRYSLGVPTYQHKEKGKVNNTKLPIFGEEEKF